jgi:predicted dinucleotide-binding enzyme
VLIGAPALFYFPRLGTASSFLFDSVAALSDEFALPELQVEQALPARALTVTAAVIAADVVLLTILFRRRSATRRAVHAFAGKFR